MELDEFSRGRLLDFAQHYLARRGWFRSLQGVPSDNDGLIPWITYPALQQLKRIVKPGFRVFEYGCGASSWWWAQKVTQVVSVEHDAAWAARTCNGKPENLTVIVREMNAPLAAADAALLAPFFADAPHLPLCRDAADSVKHGLLCPQFGAYAVELTRFPAGHFDVIVVDGMARSLTAWLAARYLKPGGFILFDNSDRWQYNAGFKALNAQGFSRIDYFGPGPVGVEETCTSIFTRGVEAFADNVYSSKGENDLGW